MTGEEWGREMVGGWMEAGGKGELRARMLRKQKNASEAREARRKPNGESNLECVKQYNDVVATSFAFNSFYIYFYFFLKMLKNKRG